MSGTNLPVRAQFTDTAAPNYVMPLRSSPVKFSVDGLRHQNPVLAYDLALRWITFYIEYTGFCGHCGFVHPQLREETKFGTVRVWCD